jgi:hypothetical protein
MDKQPTTHPGDSRDSGFDELLRSAEVKVPLPGAFQAEVWRRIAVAQETSLRGRWERILEAIFGTLARPVTASVMVLGMVSAGLWFGSLGTEPVRDAKLAYIQSVSPFAHQHGEGSR